METASPTPSPSHASGAAGPSYSAHHGDDSNDIEQIVTVTTTAASGHARYQPLGHHHQIHDDDILPFPCDPPAAPADVESGEPRGAGGQAAARPDPHHRDKGKSHRRRLAGGVPSCHMTIDSDYQNVRLAVLGAPGVGKSAIVKQFVMQQFPEEYVPTEQRQVLMITRSVTRQTMTTYGTYDVIIGSDPVVADVCLCDNLNNRIMSSRASNHDKIKCIRY